MMKSIETENVIKNIIREITRECAAKGINISDNSAAYVVMQISKYEKFLILQFIFFFLDFAL